MTMAARGAVPGGVVGDLAVALSELEPLQRHAVHAVYFECGSIREASTVLARDEADISAALAAAFRQLSWAVSPPTRDQARRGR